MDITDFDYEFKQAHKVSKFWILYSDISNRNRLQSRIPVLFAYDMWAQEFLESITAVSNQYRKDSLNGATRKNNPAYSIPTKKLVSSEKNAYNHKAACPWESYPNDFTWEARFLFKDSFHYDPDVELDFYQTGDIKITNAHTLFQKYKWAVWPGDDRDALIAEWSIMPDTSNFPYPKKVWAYDKGQIRLFSEHQMEASVLARKKMGHWGGRPQHLLHSVGGDYLNNQYEELPRMTFEEEQSVSVEDLADHYIRQREVWIEKLMKRAKAE